MPSGRITVAAVAVFGLLTCSCLGGMSDGEPWTLDTPEDVGPRAEGDAAPSHRTLEACQDVSSAHDRIFVYLEKDGSGPNQSTNCVSVALTNGSAVANEDSEVSVSGSWQYAGGSRSDGSCPDRRDWRSERRMEAQEAQRASGTITTGDSQEEPVLESIDVRLTFAGSDDDSSGDTVHMQGRNIPLDHCR